MLGAFTAGSVHAQGATEGGECSAGSYDVDLTDPSFRWITVDARIANPDGRILTGAGGDGYLEGGWASKIDGLAARTPAGLELTWEIEPGPEDFFRYWNLYLAGDPYRGEVILHYEVDLDYTRERHPFGNEQGGQYFGKAVYTVMKPIFLASEAEGDRCVQFELADGDELAVPWKPSADADRYVVESLRQLHVNPIVYGDFGYVRAEIGEFDFQLVLPGEFSDFRDDLLPTIKPLIEHYGRLFPETGEGRYLMVMFRSYADDGEGFNDGAAITTTQPISAETRVVWSDFLAHEIFHYWNGRRLRGDPSWERQWFSEGFTEYYALLSLVNLGLMDEDLFIRHLEQHLGNYLYFFNSDLYEGVTIREAGKSKGRNRHGVYSGGFVIALELDQRIRDSSNGARSLDDMMTRLYREFALTGNRYGFADLVHAASETAGEDMTEFFGLYVAERKALEAREVVGRFGLVANAFPYGNELYLLRDDQGDSARARRWRHLVSRRFEDLP
jgi:hypothetical protein